MQAVFNQSSLVHFTSLIISLSLDPQITDISEQTHKSNLIYFHRNTFAANDFCRKHFLLSSSILLFTIITDEIAEKLHRQFPVLFVRWWCHIWRYYIKIQWFSSFRLTLTAETPSSYLQWYEPLLSKPYDHAHSLFDYIMVVYMSSSPNHQQLFLYFSNVTWYTATIHKVFLYGVLHPSYINSEKFPLTQEAIWNNFWLVTYSNEQTVTSYSLLSQVICTNSFWMSVWL